MAKKTSVVLIVVGDNGVLEPVIPVRAAPDANVWFVMSNEHATHDFKLEIRDFKQKETMTSALPIQGAASHFRRLSPGEVDVVKVKTKDQTNFGAGNALPYTTYKYNVEVTDLTAGTAAVVVDPDYDVPPA
jgi:hypothetical protein